MKKENAVNTREKFLATMNFDTPVKPFLCEFGYWADTIKRWYGEGLPKVQGLPDDLSAGFAVSGSLCRLSTWIRADDVARVVNFDKSGEKITVENWIFPKFDFQVLEEKEDRLIVIDEMGVKKRISRGEKFADDSIPEYLDWPVKNRDDWEKLKCERLNPKTPGRYPHDLEKIIDKFKNRNYPLMAGGPPIGFFGSLRYLLGEVRLFTSYYDNPELIKDIINYLVDFWIQLYSPILSKVKFDWFYIWEDMCYKTGPLISPETFRAFILPAYKNFISFLKENGVNNIIVDSDGNNWKLIPLFLEGGVTGLLPMEVVAGMDVVQVRKSFPKLQIVGGIDKRALSKDKKAINEELVTKIPFMVKKGRYIPTVDHLVPPDVSLQNFVYYRHRLEELLV